MRLTAWLFRWLPPIRAALSESTDPHKFLLILLYGSIKPMSTHYECDLSGFDTFRKDLHTNRPSC
jgi:hypothetical protein